MSASITLCKARFYAYLVSLMLTSLCQALDSESAYLTLMLAETSQANEVQIFGSSNVMIIFVEFKLYPHGCAKTPINNATLVHMPNDQGTELVVSANDGTISLQASSGALLDGEEDDKLLATLNVYAVDVSTICIGNNVTSASLTLSKPFYELVPPCTCSSTSPSLHSPSLPLPFLTPVSSPPDYPIPPSLEEDRAPSKKNGGLDVVVSILIAVLCVMFVVIVVLLVGKKRVHTEDTVELTETRHEDEISDVESPAATVELVTLSHETIQRMETTTHDCEPLPEAEPADPEGDWATQGTVVDANRQEASTDEDADLKQANDHRSETDFRHCDALNWSCNSSNDGSLSSTSTTFHTARGFDEDLGSSSTGTQQ